MKKIILLLGVFVLLISCTNKKQQIMDEMESLQLQIGQFEKRTQSEYDNWIQLKSAGAEIEKDPKYIEFERNKEATSNDFQKKSDSLSAELDKVD